MNELIQQTPLLVQLIPDLPVTTVLLLNRLGQTTLIVIGFLSFYEAQMHRILIKPLRFLSWLNKYVYILYSGTGFTIGIGPRGSVAHRERHMGLLVLLLLSCLVLFSALYISDHSPLYWLTYPFIQLWKSITTWGGIQLSVLSIIWTPIKSFLFFLWSEFSLALVLTAIAILVKTILVSAHHLSSYLSQSYFRFVLAVMFVVSAGLVLVTT